jgi:hypothetical protein
MNGDSPLLRRKSLAKTGGRTPDAGSRVVAEKIHASQEAGPTFDMNLAQITSDAEGKVNTSEWMHAWFGHACGCGED